MSMSIRLPHGGVLKDVRVPRSYGAPSTEEGIDAIISSELESNILKSMENCRDRMAFMSTNKQTRDSVSEDELREWWKDDFHTDAPEGITITWKDYFKKCREHTIERGIEKACKDGEPGILHVILVDNTMFYGMLVGPIRVRWCAERYANDDVLWTWIGSRLYEPGDTYIDFGKKVLKHNLSSEHAGYNILDLLDVKADDGQVLSSINFNGWALSLQDGGFIVGLECVANSEKSLELQKIEHEKIKQVFMSTGDERWEDLKVNPNDAPYCKDVVVHSIEDLLGAPPL